MPSSDHQSVRARPAYVEEANEEGERVRGTRRTASTKKKSDKGERSSRSSKETKPRSDSGYSSHAFNAASESSSPSQRSAEVVREKDTSKGERESRRKSMTGSPTKAVRKSSKPPSAHGRNVNFDTLPNLNIPSRPKNDPSYFGVSPNSSTPVTGPSTRPMMMPNASRSARPQSYYGGMPLQDNRPPIARSAFYVPPIPAMSTPTSYPPASPSGSYMQYAAPGLADSYFGAQPQSRARPLHERFISQDPIERTASASGVKELTQAYFQQRGYTDNPKSIRRRSKEMEDLKAMPPPPRPEIRRPTIRRVTTTDSRDMPGAYPAVPLPDEMDDDDRYERRMSRTMYSPADDIPRRRSSTSRNRAYTYEPEMARVRIETPTGRRRSYYDDGQIPRSSNHEDKLRDQIRNAAGYQDEVAGGPPVNLTAEALRRVQRPSIGSRSTRSSGSKDESDWKRSATTRTTTSRSGQDADDVTIRFKGGATVNIAGAEIKCDDGAEVNIVRRKSIRNGSDRSGSEHGTTPDDRQSRSTRPLNISRSTSQSGYSDSQFNPWTYSRRPPTRGD